MEFYIFAVVLGFQVLVVMFHGRPVEEQLFLVIMVLGKVMWMFPNDNFSNVFRQVLFFKQLMGQNEKYHGLSGLVYIHRYFICTTIQQRLSFDCCPFYKVEAPIDSH